MGKEVFVLSKSQEFCLSLKKLQNFIVGDFLFFSNFENFVSFINSIPLDESKLLFIFEISPLICSYEKAIELIKKTSGSMSIVACAAKASVNNSMIAEFLNCGADDYWEIGMDERLLLAKLQAFIRRAERVEMLRSLKQVIFSEDKKICLDRREITLKILDKTGNYTPIQLTKKEADLLFLLISNENKVLNRNYLLECVWKDSSEDRNPQILDKYIQIIRKKLNSHGKRIKTLYGIGYKMEAKDI